ncbi:hypothetical protein PoB_000542500 [Plakobranchus ocellatus]|uniref:Uncharacterized protein n=1 Tax=Plakobranchus ocellatus TaxID=259542 RepID=A0AAV3Y722_9GAST|nr:hypothetical protein PoB_000542500 [Plakobranchus ocellatus]
MRRHRSHTEGSRGASGHLLLQQQTAGKYKEEMMMDGESILPPPLSQASRGVGGTVDSESAFDSCRNLSNRTPSPAPRPDGGPKSLRSPYCGLAIHKNQTKPI